MSGRIKPFQKCLKLTFPAVMIRLLEEILKPAVDFDDLAEILALDPTLAALVLKLANSPLYGSAQKVSDLTRAATILGTRELLKISLAVSFGNNLAEAFKKRHIDFLAAWRQTVWGAIAAEALAGAVCPDQAGEAYLAALMRDIALFMAACDPECKLPPLLGDDGLVQTHPGQADSEMECWGASHAQISAELLKEWNFPGHLRQAVAVHQDYEGFDTHDPLARCVILATRWAEIELGPQVNPALLVQFKGLLTLRLNLGEDQADRVRRIVSERFDAVTAILGMDGKTPPPKDFRGQPLTLMQEYYLLAQDLALVQGGLGEAAKVFARHLKWNFALDDFDLALWDASSRNFSLFEISTGKAISPATSAPRAKDLPWRMPKPGIVLCPGDTVIGELRPTEGLLDAAAADRLHLYASFAALAYEHYALRQSVLEQKAATLDSLPVGVAILDPAGAVIETNNMLRELTGAGGDLAGQDAVRTLLAPAGLDRDGEWSSFLANPQTTSTFKILCLKRPSGEEAAVCLSAHKRFRRGHPEIILVLEDVTLVPSLEMQALKQRDFLELLMRSMRDMIATVDATGRILYASPAFSRELLGRNFFDLCLPKNDYPGQWGPDVLSSPPESVEINLQSQGKTLPMECIISPLTQIGAAAPNYLIVGRDLSIIRRLEEKLKRQAMFDGLTQLLNHYHFHVAMERETVRSKRTGRPLGLMFLDLDRFKYFNDAHGHQAGDMALRQVADILRHNSRRGMDIPCRYGGDEFAVIFTEVPRENLQTVAARIIEAFRSAWKGELGVSIGLALYKTGETAQTLIARADKASYTAKTSGGSQYIWAE